MVPVALFGALGLTMAAVPTAALAAEAPDTVGTVQQETVQQGTVQQAGQTESPADPAVSDPTPASDPPATDPPASDPPASDPPVSDPPTTDPPADPPAGSTDPTPPPTDPTPPPTTTPPTDATPPPAQAPKTNPAPPSVHTPSMHTPSDSGDAAARAIAAKYAAEVASAQAEVATAKNAYDAASATYKKLKAQRDAAQGQAKILHSLAVKAAKEADTARHALGSLVQALDQHGAGNATANTLFEKSSGKNLLFQLGTLEKLSKLTGGVKAVRARIDADETRAKALRQQEDAALDVVNGAGVDQARVAMNAAKTALDAAEARLAQVTAAASAALDALAPTTRMLATGDVGQLSDQGWADPAIGPITDNFGPRVSPGPGASTYHQGDDIGAACGSPIRAATGGVVEEADRLGSYGNWILIAHGSGIETGYAHIATGDTLVSVGETVSAGQVIAGVGRTGNATGCHLHFEVRIDGTKIDPMPFMANRGIILGG